MPPGEQEVPPGEREVPPVGQEVPPGPPLPGGVCGGGPGREGGVGQPAASAVLMASAIGALEAGFWPVKRLASWTVKAW
ncbi:hypothetical protein GCM10018782_10250 [Streptomyces griseoaurantiacus]|nr:hypothetical protein GCM10018782_10250 [Streptomyces griseoaurantiacus]